MSDETSVQRLTRARLRALQKLLTAKGRREQKQFLIEGTKLLRDAIEADAPIAEILSQTPDLWSNADLRLTSITRADAERLSDTRTPQGHFALVRDTLSSLNVPDSEEWQIVALDGVQDAGNVGGIIRSAAAFGVDGVIVGHGSADPTHPRVVRAATGAWFQIPIVRSEDLHEELTLLRDRGATILAADRSGSLLTDVEIPSKRVWLFGSEGSGINPELEPLIDDHVAIPIADRVDSLNVNVAAGIILNHGYQRAAERSTP